MIVDDSHSVWAQHRRNLVVVERYVFFPSSRLQLGMARPSLVEANRRGGKGGAAGAALDGPAAKPGAGAATCCASLRL